MESWMGRMDTFEMERIDHATMPFYPPPCQDHEFPTSRKLKDLEGGGCFGTNMSGSDVVLGVGTWDRAGCPVPASGAFLTCSSLHNQVLLALSHCLAFQRVQIIWVPLEHLSQGQGCKPSGGLSLKPS